MKTTNPALISTARHGATLNLRSVLDGECVLLSVLLGKPATNRALIGAIVCALASIAAILTASDAVREYGWAAFFALLAACSAKPVYDSIK